MGRRKDLEMNENPPGIIRRWRKKQNAMANVLFNHFSKKQRISCPIARQMSCEIERFEETGSDTWGGRVRGSKRIVPKERRIVDIYLQQYEPYTAKLFRSRFAIQRKMYRIVCADLHGKKADNWETKR